jgi:nucleoid DNA-binding protein
MTRDGITRKVSRKIGCSCWTAKEFLDTILAAMIETLAKDGQIKLRDFGTFTVVRRAPRLGRDLADTSKSIQIPARLGVKFLASPKLKQAIRKAK